MRDREQRSRLAPARAGQRPQPSAHRGEVVAGFALLLALVAAVGLLAQITVRPPWQSQTPELPTATITIGDVPLTVELAVSPEARARGLGYRDALAPGTGMLFISREPRVQSFWMKGMRFCLDIVWIERDQIVGAAESICPAPPGVPDADIPRASSPEPVRFVLEVPAGWLEAHGFGVGTPVEF